MVRIMFEKTKVFVMHLVAFDGRKEKLTIIVLEKCLVVDLEKKGYTASVGSIIKATKNAVSLLLSRKKQMPLSMLTVYVSKSSLESIEDNVVIETSPNKDDPQNNRNNDVDNNERQTHSAVTSLPFVTSNPMISFFMDGDVLQAKINFDYLLEYFKYSLSSNKNPMKINKILDDVFTHVFVQLKCSVNVRDLKQEISRQISHIVPFARAIAGGRSVIKVLREMNIFLFTFKSMIGLQSIGSSVDVVEFNG